MDSFISFSTLIATLVYIYFNLNIEDFLGAIISIVIIKAGLDILKESISDIIGNRTDSKLAKELKTFIAQYQPIEGIYDLSLHQYGPEKLIGSVHIELPDNITAKEIHILTREITVAVYEKLKIILTIGIYASNDDETETKTIKEYLDSLIRKNLEIIQLHGFYVNHNEVSFDLIIDFSANREEIRRIYWKK